MDDYLDEAMANENYDCSNGPTPPKLGKASPQVSYNLSFLRKIDDYRLRREMKER